MRMIVWVELPQKALLLKRTVEPNSGDIFYVSPPQFELTVNDPHLELVWYTIDDGITNYTITEYEGFFNQAAWDAIPVGDLTFIVYAKDSLGNIAFSQIHITKESVSNPPSGPNIPSYNLFILIGTISIAILLTIRKKNYK